MLRNFVRRTEMPSLRTSSIRKSPLFVLFLICLCVSLLLIHSIYSWNTVPESYKEGTIGATDRSLENGSGTDPSTPINWNEVDEKVFKPHGFAVVKSTINSFPVVRRLKHQTCEEIFKQWLAINSVKPSWKKPPRDIPQSERSHFLMNGYANLTYWYFNEIWSETIVWKKDRIDKMIKSSDIVSSYDDGASVYFATQKYSIRNQTGLAVGSVSPWVEATCIKNGAKKMVTVDYQPIKCDHPMITFVDAITLAKDWKKYAGTFDFAVTFSSLEHSGLGRYSDQLDPIGDLREMQKMRCLIKKGGLLFLGIPVGLDNVTFNAHRIYGRIRLPMMLEGYELLDMYYNHSSISMKKLAIDMRMSEGPQILFVLRKQEESYFGKIKNFLF